MLFRLADRLRAHSDSGEQLPWEVEMACIESFALHARVLIEFLWNDPRANSRHPDDVFAADYFPPGEWAELRERVQRSKLDGLTERTGHEIAHLSYKRMQDSDRSRDWQFDVIAGVFGRAFRLFLENVSADVIAYDFEDRLRSTWPEYLNYPVAVGFPGDQNPRSVATAPLLDPNQVHPASFEDLLPKQ
ncbi:MAG: hypothetical protein WB507_06175 [Solirubrobacterales bacterium]